MFTMSRYYFAIIAFVFINTGALSEELDCRFKPGCSMNNCDPSPPSLSHPSSNIDEYLRKKQFPITCETQKKKSSDDVLRLYADNAVNRQEIRELKEGMQKMTQKVAMLEKKNEDAEKEINDLRYQLKELRQDADETRRIGVQKERQDDSEEVSCSSPIIKCGTIGGSHPFKVGSVVSFTCNEGLELVGKATATCTADGSWNHPLPKCERIVGQNGSCSFGYTGLALACYRIYDELVTYAEAKKICEQDGGQLASVQSKHVNDFLRSETSVQGARYWVGLHISNSKMLWPNGDTFEPAHGVDYDLTSTNKYNCMTYIYSTVYKAVTWKIRYHDCNQKSRFICEVWKNNASPYVVTSTGHVILAGIEGVYHPVSGLVTFETKRQIYRNENDSKSYLFYDFHRGVGERNWFIGGYDIKHGRPSLLYKIRTNTDVHEPDQINTPWVNSRRHRININIKKQGGEATSCSP